jgi:hypothetical protein
MNPGVGGNLLFPAKPYHLHAGRIAGRPACATSERGLQLPDRCIARPADSFQCQAGTRFAALALDLQPRIAGIEALPDRGRRPRGPTIALHLLRPEQAFGGVSLADRLLGLLAGMLRAYPCTLDAIAKSSLSIAARHLVISQAFGDLRNMAAGSTICRDDSWSARRLVGLRLPCSLRAAIPWLEGRLEIGKPACPDIHRP